MADTVGSAEFLVKIKDMVTGPMKGIASSITSTLKQIGSIAAGNLLASGIQNAVSSISNMISVGISANAQFDQLNVSFTQILGSARLAAAVLKDIQKYASITPFDTQGLAQAASSLLATNKIAQKNLLPTLKKLGDAAAGSSVGFAAMPRVVKAVTDMLNKGKLSLQEFNQLSEAGVPAFTLLAKKMNISEAALSKLISSGKTSNKEILMLVDALGAKYNGLAEKQSKTFSGLMSTLQDNATMAAAQITRPIYDQMTKMMQGLADGMGTGAFTVSIEKMTAGVKYLVDTFDKITSSPLTKVVVQVAAIAAGFILAGAALTWVPTLIGLAASLAPLAATIIAIGAAAAGLAVLIRNAFTGDDAPEFNRQLTEIWGLIKEIGANISDALLPVLNQVGAAIAAAFGQAGSLQAGFNEFVGTVLGGISSILDIVSILTADFGKTWEFIQFKAAASIAYISEALRHLFLEEAPNLAVAFSEAMFESIDQIVLALYEIIPAIGDMALEISGATTQFVADLFAGMGEISTELATMTSMMVNNFQSLFKSLAVFVGDIFGAMFADIHARLQNAIAAAKALIAADSRTAFRLGQKAAFGDGTLEKKGAAAAGKFNEANKDLFGGLKNRADKIGDIFADKIAGGAKRFTDGLLASKDRFAGIVGENMVGGAKKVAEVFNNIRAMVPNMKTPMFDLFTGAAGAKWQEMLKIRDNKAGVRERAAVFDKGMKDLGLDKVVDVIGNVMGRFEKGKAFDDIGAFLGGAVAEGGKGLLGGLDAAVGLLGRDEKKKKKKAAEFVGLADLNKRIQVGLTKEDKKAAAALKAAQGGQKAAEKGAAAGVKLCEIANGIKEGVGKLFVGFGK